MTNIPHHILAQYAEYSYYNQTFRACEVECVIVELDDVTILAIRGTEPISNFKERGIVDVIRYLTIMPMWVKGLGVCHYGFGKSASIIVHDRLQYMLRKDIPIVCTGHSAGAIISLMSARLLSNMSYQVVEWVGFGCPRGFVGTRKYSFPLTQYRYANDVVCMLPPVFPFGFMHQCANTQLSTRTKTITMSDHDMINYVVNMSGDSNDI